jgi:aerobic C4-dicarboxylate transport protein
VPPARAIGKCGIAILVSLGKLMIAFYTSCIVFVFVVLGVIASSAGFRKADAEADTPERVLVQEKIAAGGEPKPLSTQN